MADSAVTAEASVHGLNAVESVDTVETIGLQGRNIKQAKASEGEGKISPVCVSVGIVSPDNEQNFIAS